MSRVEKPLDTTLELLKEKWRVWFNWLDINKDGVLTSADWNQGAETLIKEHDLQDTKAETVRQSFKELGKTLLGDGPMKGQIAVPMHSLVDNLTAFYSKNSYTAYEYIRKTAGRLFLIMDVDCNSCISKKEFVALCKSLGLNAKSAEIYYADMRNSEFDTVAIDDAVNWWVDIWFGTDRDYWEKFLKISEVQ